MAKYTSIVAILGITVIQVFALSQDINGTMMAASIAVLSGLGGYSVKEFMGVKK